MFGRLRGLPDLPAFVKNIPLDSWFPETVALAMPKIPLPILLCRLRLVYKPAYRRAYRQIRGLSGDKPLRLQR